MIYHKSTNPTIPVIDGNRHLQNNSLLSKNNLQRQPEENRAKHFPVGWQRGDTPIIVKDIQLNRSGVKIIPLP